MCAGGHGIEYKNQKVMLHKTLVRSHLQQCTVPVAAYRKNVEDLGEGAEVHQDVALNGVYYLQEVGQTWIFLLQCWRQGDNLRIIQK